LKKYSPRLIPRNILPRYLIPDKIRNDKLYKIMNVKGMHF
jgi:hypothetical protein